MILSLLDPRFWLGMVAVAVLSGAAGYYKGHASATKSAELKEAKIQMQQAEQLAAATAAAKTNTDKLTLKLTEVQNASYRDGKTKDAKINELRAAVRSGAERLYIPVAARSDAANGAGAAPTAASTTETRAELLPETADGLIGIVADANAEVRRTNECIDLYNTVKEALNKKPASAGRE